MYLITKIWATNCCRIWKVLWFWCNDHHWLPRKQPRPSSTWAVDKEDNFFHLFCWRTCGHWRTNLTTSSWGLIVWNIHETTSVVRRDRDRNGVASCVTFNFVFSNFLLCHRYSFMSIRICYYRPTCVCSYERIRASNVRPSKLYCYWHHWSC